MVGRCFEDLVSICHRERALAHDAHMYKENPRDLYLEVAGLLQLAPSLPSDEIRTIIVPNNALRYTGGIMAEAYAQICPINMFVFLFPKTQYCRKRIFVITPHERLVENKFLLSSCDCLMTSNYSIPVDKDISHEIWKTGSCEYISRLEDERNLGVEIQLPFITKIMEDHKENFTIIPIYVGLIEFRNISWFAMKLMPYFKDKTNLFIFSLSLTHWGKVKLFSNVNCLGSIYGFDRLNESKPTVLDTIKEHDICAIEALKTLNFKAFDLQISLAKTPLPDFPVWGIFLKLAQTLLDEEEYRCRKLPDAEFFKAYQEVGELKVHGLAWSLPNLTKDRSSISFVSASFRRYFKKCWTGLPNPCGEMDKPCP